ncbi:MAG: cardiolipin synthase [Butyricicoccus sp.]|nr:cardiolipin synthase [Butyricicoccus sp.]
MKRQLGKLLGDRRIMGGVLLILQAILVVWGMSTLIAYVPWVDRFCTMLSVVIIIWLVRKYDNPSYKIPWIILILLFPLFGGLFYLLWGNTPFNRARALHKFTPLHPDFSVGVSHPAGSRLTAAMPRHTRRTNYIESLTGMPAWGETATRYFPVGEKQFEAMCLELKKAERFIFMEYFIIEPGVMWNPILDILVEKVRQGVEVRIMYDDAGCLSKLPAGYDRYLRSLGMRVVRFNRFIPTLNTYLNYRDHRKIMVIDGNVGYMGGTNIADEYINHNSPFGHWKDTSIELRGAGVASMTELFLEMWEYATGVAAADHMQYRPTLSRPGDGYVQSFGDSPLDDFNVGETVYMQIINNARNYVYITTPYLILDNEMIQALTTAAQSGVDVRIITPGIPDKKLVYLATRSFYQQLSRAGVHIYEYTPGFLHAKMIVSDDDVGVVGTINMDFRSFFMHFECGTVLYGGKIIHDIKNDMLDIIGQSRTMDREWFRHVPWLSSILASIMRLFAPLL